MFVQKSLEGIGIWSFTNIKWLTVSQLYNTVEKGIYKMTVMYDNGVMDIILNYACSAQKI